jgi:hypothetical protein
MIQPIASRQMIFDENTGQQNLRVEGYPSSPTIGDHVLPPIPT